MRPPITITIALLGLTLLISVFGANLLHTQRIQEERATALASDAGDEGGSDEDQDEGVVNLDHLRALGYVEWDEDADSSKQGVTLIDQLRASDDIGLYTNGRSTAYLIDRDGNTLHEWNAPPFSGGCEYAELLPNDLLVLVCINRSILYLDWNSNLVSKTELSAHHEAAPIGDQGAVLVPVHEQHSYLGRPVTFDAIVRVEPGRPPERIFSTWDAREELQRHHEPLVLDQEELPEKVSNWMTMKEGFDYYHLNSIEVLPATSLGEQDPRFRPGNLLISFRNTHLVVILDGESKEIVWSWGPGEVELQHHPRMLANGNILLFDNGTFRKWSRVIELNPVSKKIEWEYRADDFYSNYRGSSQRLANGNTVICESESGRVFEVSPEGEIVWEFWNTAFDSKTKRRLIYRFLKLPAERVVEVAARNGKKLDLAKVQRAEP